MKTFKFLIIICFLFSNCDETDKGNLVNYKFYIKNETGKSFSLSLFKQNNSLFSSTSINIDSIELLDEGFLDPGFDIQFSLTKDLDSAEFIFSDGKKLVQTYFNRGINDTINNVLSSSYFKMSNSNEITKTFFFTLSENDYLRAK